MLAECSRGECAKYDAHAADAIALAPEASFPFLARAQGLARSHAPPETLRAALDEWASRRIPPVLGALDARDTYDLWTGDFDDLRSRRAARDATLATVTDRLMQANAAYVLIAALHESGQDTEAGSVATAFVAKRPLYRTALTMGLGSQDGSAYVLAAARVYGGMPGDRWIKLRDEWYAEWTSSGTAGEGRIAWPLLFGGTAVTRADAESALASVPDEVRDRLDVWGDSEGSLALGHLYVLVERWDDAIRLIERAEAACDVLNDIPGLVRAHVELAQAYTAKSNTAGACAQHLWVVDLWGGAKPRSVTAEASKKAMKALGCTTPP
jgi:serine/threonine-protein kinase